MAGMTQTSLGLDKTNKRTRKCEFLGETEREVPWSALVALIEPSQPESKEGPPTSSHRDHAAHPLHAERAHLQRPDDGRVTDRHGAAPCVRATQRRCVTCPGSHASHDHTGLHRGRDGSETELAHAKQKDSAWIHVTWRWRLWSWS